jgi:hypothetical protein
MDPYTGFPDWAGDVQGLSNALETAKEALMKHMQGSSDHSWASWLFGTTKFPDNIGASLLLDLSQSEQHVRRLK